MNLDRISPQGVAPQPIGATRQRTSRIDLTSAEPAVPASSTHTGRAKPGTVASIRGVLTSDEERAIADMFAPRRSGYTRSGTATGPVSVPGLRLNLQA